MAAGAKGATGARGVLGARAARVLLAVAASTLLTAVVAAPLAYQAHAARATPEERPAPTSTVPPPSVLGTSTVPTSFTTSTSTSTSSAPTTAAPGSAATPPTTTAGGSAQGPAGDGAGPTTTVPWFVAPAPPDTGTTVPVAPTTVPPTTPPTTLPPISAAGLYVSISQALDAPAALQGATLRTASFVFLDLPDVAGVQFFLDGRLTATEFQAPWELLGGLPLVPRSLDGDQHTVRAEVTFTDGRRETRQATFTTALPG